MLKLSEQVQAVMLNENITAEELNTMVESAALTSHERGNRRFHNWLFQIKDSTVQRMTQLLDVKITKPQRHLASDFTSHQDHEPCGGEGCKECGYIGQVTVKYVATAAHKAQGARQK